MPKLPKIKWLLPMGILTDEEFTKMLEGGFLRTIEHMDVVVAGIIVSEMPRDMPTYASCSAVLFKLIVKSAFSVVKINSEEFNDLLDRFTMAFHILKGIKFTVVTKLKVNIHLYRRQKLWTCVLT